jgi:hypothetical protein
MKCSFIAAVAAVVFLFSCNNNDNNPDVSNIKINLKTVRFEKKLFDTSASSLLSYLQRLESSDPSFTATYLRKILNADPQWPADTTAAFVNGFVKAFRPVYDSAEKIFNDFSPYEKEIVKGLQFVKYYFPQYKTPEKIITYIGPLDGFGDVIAEEGFLVGLHHHLGKNFSLYKSEMIRETYPDYISARFEPGYIAVNCMKNVVLDIYPEKENDKPLINQMIEKGKRLYILSRLLPGTEEYKLIGYTEEQMKDCYKHEAVIWDLFVKNNYLQSTDKNINKNFIGEGPKTQELGEGAPGNIGSYAGWQIVKKYMQKNAATTLQQLISLDEETIFQAAKYKP